MSDSPSTVVESSTPASTPAPGGEAGAAPEISSGAEGVSGSSPSADGAAEPREALLEVVRKAAPRREREPGDPSTTGAPGPGASPAPNARDAGEDLGPLTQAEFDVYSDKTKKRIRQFQREISELRKEAEPLRTQASTTTQLQQFLQTADIAKEDFGLVLDLAAAMRRGDFRTFLEGVAPYVQLAQESLGITLPADLAQAVRQGHMTQQAASYVAQERTARQLAEARATRMTTDINAYNDSNAKAQFQSSVHDAVVAWESATRRSDPDYARKEPVVRDLLHAVVQERGPPRSPQEAVEIARQAYVRANQIVSSFNPQPRSTPRVPSSINRVNTGNAPEPRTLKDAVHFALARSR